MKTWIRIAAVCMLAVLLIGCTQKQQTVWETTQAKETFNEKDMLEFRLRNTLDENITGFNIRFLQDGKVRFASAVVSSEEQTPLEELSVIQADMGAFSKKDTLVLECTLYTADGKEIPCSESIRIPCVPGTTTNLVLRQYGEEYILAVE